MSPERLTGPGPTFPSPYVEYTTYMHEYVDPKKFDIYSLWIRFNYYSSHIVVSERSREQVAAICQALDFEIKMRQAEQEALERAFEGGAA